MCSGVESPLQLVILTYLMLSGRLALPWDSSPALTCWEVLSFINCKLPHSSWSPLPTIDSISS